MAWLRDPSAIAPRLQSVQGLRLLRDSCNGFEAPADLSPVMGGPAS